MTDVAIALAAVAAIAVAEIVLSTKWHRGYFASGIPIFWRRIERAADLVDLDLDALQKSAATVAATPLLFRRVDPNLILFREKAFGGSMHYAPLMRGVIRRRAEEASVVVLGLVNWTFVAFVAVFALLLRDDFIDIAPTLLVVYAVLYLIQSVRFARVARALRRQVATA